jgi:hypothetical protein
MLGDLIYEAKGKVTSIRGVIDVKGGVFADLGEHIIQSVKEFSWQKMMIVKW